MKKKAHIQGAGVGEGAQVIVQVAAMATGKALLQDRAVIPEGEIILDREGIQEPGL